MVVRILIMLLSFTGFAHAAERLHEEGAGEMEADVREERAGDPGLGLRLAETLGDPIPHAGQLIRGRYRLPQDGPCGRRWRLRARFGRIGSRNRARRTSAPRMEPAEWSWQR